ncbi:putative ribonuclease H-like domain-containing protein [Tanacetum coccineum]
MQEELLQFKLQQVWTLVDLPHGKRAIGTKWVYRNKKDERGIVIRNNARLVAQGYTQEEGIDYDEVFAPVARIEAIRLFLAYASFKDFVVYQMDVKSAFLHGKIEEEVYVCQPLGFEDPEFPDRVYKVKGDILLVQVYVDDIIFGSTKKGLCIEFEKLMHKKFQMNSMGELTFFLGLHVTKKDDGIFISQDKYVDGILKKFGFTTVKTASTPMETSKPLMKDENAEDVDVYLYRSMIGSLMYLTSSRPNIMFVVCACARFQVTPKVSHLHTVKRIFRYLKDRKSTIGDCQFLRSRLISWQCKKQTVVANSTTEAEYVAASNCRGQVLWIQNQLLDYGYNFMNTKIFIDNESTICIVKNLVFHSKSKHIEIRHHFIRDSYEKRLIQVIKIHIDHNVADLLTKASDIDVWNVNAVRQKVSTAGRMLVLPGKNKTVHEERGDSVKRAATTAASLDVEQDSGNILRTQFTAILNEPIPQGTSSVEKKKKERTLQLKRRLFKVRIESSVEKSLGDQEDASKQGRNEDQDEDISWFQEDAETQGRYGHDIRITTAEPVTTASVPVTTASPTILVDDSITDDITLAETLMKIKISASRPQKAKGVVVKEPSEPTTASRPQPHILAKDKGKCIMLEPKKPMKVK